jgi:hypothetical protein
MISKTLNFITTLRVLERYGESGDPESSSG